MFTVYLEFYTGTTVIDQMKKTVAQKSLQKVLYATPNNLVENV